MKPEVVQAVRSRDAEQPVPTLFRHGRITGERKDGAFQRAAEEEWPAIEIELRAAGFAVVQQCSVTVHYNDIVVCEYFADPVG